MNELPNTPGTYALVFRNHTQRRIPVGALGEVVLMRGYYIYVGSAFGPGGLRARVGRHARIEKTKHWHIDYLRPHLSLIEAWYTSDPEKLEHRWAGLLERELSVAWPRFGASDCRCPAHLFYASTLPTGLLPDEHRCNPEVDPGISVVIASLVNLRPVIT